jgi:hypothetical protein
MIELSVQYLNSLRRVMSRDYMPGSGTIQRDDEMMYAYKCGLYEQCFRVSLEGILHYNDSSRLVLILTARGSDLLYS